MWALFPIAGLVVLVALATGRRKALPGAATTPAAKRPISRANGEMGLGLHQSGKRYGIWREQAGVLVPLKFTDVDPTSEFNQLPLNPNQTLYLWDRNHSTREPRTTRARLRS